MSRKPVDKRVRMAQDASEREDRRRDSLGRYERNPSTLSVVAMAFQGGPVSLGHARAELERGE